ncbi:MAG: histidine kinase [Ginsengibacter sp.]
MKQIIPYNKIIRLALITTFLFGLFGATPALEFGRRDAGRIRTIKGEAGNTIYVGIEPGRKDFRSISTGFLVVSAVTLMFWIINTGLLWAGQEFFPSKYNWLRYVVSVLLAAIIIILIFNLLLPPFNRTIAFENGSRMINGIRLPPIDLQKNMPPLPGGRPRRLFLFPLIQAQSVNIIIIVLIEMVLLRDTKMQIENENNLLRMANLEAKHSQLKQQLQPHFLFNSLNVLKSLIKRFPEQAEDYLEKLSEFLRFSINSNMQTLIPLKEELELVTNYLHMQQVRFGNALDFNINIPTSFQQGRKVPVYSLQLLAENAIKHNILTIEDPLHISINADEEEKTLTVSNNLQPKTIMDETHGVGLANLTERYKLLGDYKIDFSKTISEFTVTIKVLENENSNHRG